MQSSWKSLLPIPSLAQLQEVRDNFINELKNAQEGSKSSLSFIKNSLPKKSALEDGDKLQVVVVGGSILVTAIATKQGDSISFSKKTQEKLPTLSSSKVLYSFLASCIYKETSILCLNFAFPLNTYFRGDILDGTLLWGTKEHALADLVGKPIGQGLEDYFRENKNRDLRVLLANDLVCLALAAKGFCPWDKTAFLILGTGINASFYVDGQKIVNLEAANFDKFTSSEAALEVNKSALSPQMTQLEKEVAGGYLHLQYNYIVSKYPELSLRPVKETRELSERITSTKDPLAEAIFRKSAALVAACIAGLYSHLGQKPDFCVIIEGSMIRKSLIFRDYLYEYLEQLKVKDKIRFVSIEDSSIIGAAGLAMA